MTLTTNQPISAALLDIALLNDDGDAILRIDGGAHRLRLVLTNLTTNDITFGDAHGTSLSVMFRPGVLKDFDQATVTTPGWTALSARELSTLVLTHSDGVTLEPNVPYEIEIAGLTAADVGGSRSTRVSVEYENAHLAGEGTVSARRTLHLGVLHPLVAPGTVHGSSGTSGPFAARIEGTSMVLNDGAIHPITVTLSTSRPVELSATERARFTIPKSGDMPATVTIDSITKKGRGTWTEPNPVIEFASKSDTALTAGGDFLTLNLSVASDAAPGLYPLSIEYANVGDKDGSIVLLLQITTVATRSEPGASVVTSRSLEVGGNLTIRGHDGVGSRLDFGDSWYVGAQQGVLWLESKHGNKPQITFAGTEEGAALLIERSAKHAPLSLGGTANVGIGVDKPSRKLDVDGSVKATSFVFGQWEMAPNANKSEEWISFRKDGGSYSTFWLSNRLDANVAELALGAPKQNANIQARTKKLGINNRDPQHTLDVSGDIRAHSLTVAMPGKRAELTLGEHVLTSHNGYFGVGSRTDGGGRMILGIFDDKPTTIATRRGLSIVSDLGGGVAINKDKARFSLDVAGYIGTDGLFFSDDTAMAVGKFRVSTADTHLRGTTLPGSTKDVAGLGFFVDGTPALVLSSEGDLWKGADFTIKRIDK